VNPSIVYVLPDKMGGMMTIIANLLAHRRPDALTYWALLTHNRLSVDTPCCQALQADRQVRVEYSLPLENLHAVLRRLAAAVPVGPGALVANDLLELAMASLCDTGRTVIQILHGDHEYYYSLAATHEPVIDVFVAYSRATYERLQERLPHRRESIVHLPFGVPIPPQVRTAMPGRLRLLFAGRLENEQKGVLELPVIDQHLRELGCTVQWTLVGAGPDEEQLRACWGDQPHVRWLGVKTNAQVIDLYADHDIFVLPTRDEGFSVALLEAMGAGLVPVVSDIRSGVPEVVEPGVTGFRPAVGDIAGFAAAIATLDRNRDQLEAMSRAARQTVIERFDIRERVAGYQALYARWSELRRPRPKEIALPYGSRLDQPWLPNGAVYAVRATRRWLKGAGRDRR